MEEGQGNLDAYRLTGTSVRVDGSNEKSLSMTV